MKKTGLHSTTGKMGKRTTKSVATSGYYSMHLYDACKALNRISLLQLRLKECFCDIEARVTLVFVRAWIDGQCIQRPASPRDPGRDGG